MNILNWMNAKTHFRKVRAELQGIVDELGPEVESTNGKLKKVMASVVTIAKILVRVIDQLPG